MNLSDDVPKFTSKSQSINPGRDVAGTRIIESGKPDVIISTDGEDKTG